jgi:2-methylisocitrate lyase-like PEP mutase family enzyme
LGYADGERIPPDEMLAWVARIARAVAVPVTADVEAGYGRTPEAVAATARRVIEAGAVGMNLEDSIGEEAATLAPIALQVEKVHAIREAADAAGVPLVLNARTDIYLAGVGEPSSRFGETVKRLNAFHEAGADCLFAPGVADAATLAALAREVHGPLNILAVRATPPIAELEQMGVRRVSVGSGPARAALTLMRRIGQELREQGTYSGFTEGVMTYAEVNKLFER